MSGMEQKNYEFEIKNKLVVLKKHDQVIEVKSLKVIGD